MTFEELTEKISALECEEVRTRNESFLEVVVARTRLPELAETLKAYFGEPFKPEGQKPSRESDKYANPYGGARKDQTLYRRTEGDPATAILWPWGSGTRITVKIIKES